MQKAACSTYVTLQVSVAAYVGMVLLAVISPVSHMHKMSTQDRLPEWLRGRT